MTHASGAFAVDAKALDFGTAHAEYSEVVPSLGRKACGVNEGLLELDGRAWRAFSRPVPAPKDSNLKSFYRGEMEPMPELDAWLSGLSAKKP